MKKSNKNTSIVLNGKEFNVPPGGTLGVLALGHVGIKAWRASKEKWEKENKQNEKED